MVGCRVKHGSHCQAILPARCSYRCGLLPQMSDVAWYVSVCLSLCVCLLHGCMNFAKMAEPIVSRLGQTHVDRRNNELDRVGAIFESERADPL